MRLTHLDQIIELERGEADVLCSAVMAYGERAVQQLHNLSAPALPATQLLGLAALERVAARLWRLNVREQARTGMPRRKPTAFRLRADELVAVMLYVFPHADISARVVLGKVHQQSLNLDRYVNFSAR